MSKVAKRLEAELRRKIRQAKQAQDKAAEEAARKQLDEVMG